MRKRRWLGLIAPLGAAVLAVAACSDQAGDGSGDVATWQAELNSQEVLGFETLDSWTVSAGRKSLSSTRTQGAAALSLTGVVNHTTLVSGPVASNAVNGITTAASKLALDLSLPNNRSLSFGALQLFVTAPSRGIFNQFVGQVDLTPLPRGTFRSLEFDVTDAVRDRLRGGSFSDLSFTLALNASPNANGTYLFDNLHVIAAGPDPDPDPGPTVDVLSGYETVPSLSTTGTGTFRISQTGAQLDFTLSYEALESEVTQSHVHFAQRGVNGGISVFLCTNLGNGPAGVPACPPAPATITGSISAASIVGPAGQGIAPGEFDEFVAALRAEATYVSVHSIARPAGEIRAQIESFD